jgi:hypothetical protein
LQAGGLLQAIVDPKHVPLMQLSGPVHESPSLQLVPLVTLVGAEQLPVDVLQVPAILHMPGLGQVTGLPPVQLPPMQVSVCVHGLPSSQPVPVAALVGVEQAPVDGLQVPGTLQAGAVHVVAVPGMHVPAWQLSPTVHMLPSLHVVPFVTAAQLPLFVAHIVQPPHAEPAFCQAPLASHICGCDPLQVFAPGMQMPVHAPLAQTYGQAVPLLCQAPFASHSCG